MGMDCLHGTSIPGCDNCDYHARRGRYAPPTSYKEAVSDFASKLDRVPEEIKEMSGVPSLVVKDHVGGIQLGVSAKRAQSAMESLCAQLTAYDFQGAMMAEVICDDGATFKVPSAFLREWTDPKDGMEWIFMLCEHYPAMSFDKDDLLHWANYERNFDYVGKCLHLPQQVKEGPQVPMYYGTGPTEVCSCGMYRNMLHKPGRWVPGPPNTVRED